MTTIGRTRRCPARRKRWGRGMPPGCYVHRPPGGAGDAGGSDAGAGGAGGGVAGTVVGSVGDDVVGDVEYLVGRL